METTDTNSVLAAYTYGDDLISMNRADANSYYLCDGLGSTRQLAADNESVVASYDYDAFGNVISSVGSVVNPYGFTGEQQFNEADSLVFLRARYYKPSIGRFISKDPIGYEGGINLYAYVENDPVNFSDPYGIRRERPSGPPRWRRRGYPSLSACMGDAMTPLCSSLWAALGMGGVGAGGMFCPAVGIGGGAWALYCAGEATGAYLFCTVKDD
ncbi:MAG: RHS repeat-associated core domain-containing protein [Phycisphaerae bacterium]|nr:RHS repeat-associated core domain-containing protein [Phycisphaerae bacterium]MDD5380727.1 RHS repeat-associated core domain-containing protein [Phycisphaerae bacterium]